jgi:hypothetical protein
MERQRARRSFFFNAALAFLALVGALWLVMLHEWGGAVVALVLCWTIAVMVLPKELATGWPKYSLLLRIRCSKAQKMAIGFVVGVPTWIMFLVLSERLSASAIMLGSLSSIAAAVWLIRIIRSEGWTGREE